MLENRSHASGFSVIEIAVTVLVIGILMAFSVPAFQTISSTYRLKGTAENLAAQVRLGREKAIATGTDQVMIFALDTNNSDYRVHLGSQVGPVVARWDFPRGIVYDENPVEDLDTLRLKKDGRASPSGVVVVSDPKGNRDTVSVQLSGLVLIR